MNDIELTILMPCLNEETTLPTCIKKAQEFIKKENLNVTALYGLGRTTQTMHKSQRKEEEKQHGENERSGIL